MERRFGQTIGKHMTRTRVFDTSRPAAMGLPFKKALLRNIYKWLPFLPCFGVLIAFAVAGAGNADRMFGGSFFYWFAAAGAIWAIWQLWALTAIIGKSDPFFDVWAGTTVIPAPPPRGKSSAANPT